MTRRAGTAGLRDLGADVIRHDRAADVGDLGGGVHPLEVSEIHSMTEMVVRAVRAAQHERFAKTRDEVVVTAGVPFGTPGTTNALRVAVVR